MSTVNPPTLDGVDKFGNVGIVINTVDDTGMIIGIHRSLYYPGSWDNSGKWVDTDLSNLDAVTQSILKQAWTTELVNAYKLAFPYIPPKPPSTDPNDYPLEPFQFWAMVAIAGLQPAIDNAMTKLTDPVQKAVATSKLNHTKLFNRNDPLVALLSADAGLTSQQVDTYWMQAKDIK